MATDFKAPWSVGGNEILGDHIYDAEGQPVAIVDGLPNAERNGRLIKAAPRLYETLRWFLEFCDEHPEWTENELCNGMDDSAEACWLADVRAALAQVGAP